ncbi:hypothetical protein [Phytohalomonas tamaricis]|uniref:hypothetical protein n=1 Tax=Phytohalomonas tamaricis TaxID=2081032 RepID=UPI000D0B2BFA|nr:hypothetical protein [Phytohalomonas tamaricis]
MTGQCRDLSEVEIYLRKINALGLSAEHAKDDSHGKDIDAELDYTLKAAVRHLSIWGPGVRAVNFRALTLRLEQTLDSLPADHFRHRQVLSVALDFFEDGVRQTRSVTPVASHGVQRHAM